MNRYPFHKLSTLSKKNIRAYDIYLSAKETHIFEMPDNHSRHSNIIV